MTAAPAPCNRSSPRRLPRSGSPSQTAELALAAGFEPLATAAQGDATLPTDRCAIAVARTSSNGRRGTGYLKQELLAGLCGVVMAANLYTEEQFRALGIQAKAPGL